MLSPVETGSVASDHPANYIMGSVVQVFENVQDPDKTGLFNVMKLLNQRGAGDTVAKALGIDAPRNSEVRTFLACIGNFYGDDGEVSTDNLQAAAEVYKRLEQAINERAIADVVSPVSHHVAVEDFVASGAYDSSVLGDLREAVARVTGGEGVLEDDVAIGSDPNDVLRALCARLDEHADEAKKSRTEAAATAIKVVREFGEELRLKKDALDAAEATRMANEKTIESCHATRLQLESDKRELEKRVTALESTKRKLIQQNNELEHAVRVFEGKGPHASPSERWTLALTS